MGVGLRVKSFDEVLLRLDAAWGTEGGRFYVRFGPLLTMARAASPGIAPRWPRRPPRRRSALPRRSARARPRDQAPVPPARPRGALHRLRRHRADVPPPAAGRAGARAQRQHAGRGARLELVREPDRRARDDDRRGWSAAASTGEGPGRALDDRLRQVRGHHARLHDAGRGGRGVVREVRPPPSTRSSPRERR